MQGFAGLVLIGLGPGRPWRRVCFSCSIRSCFAGTIRDIAIYRRGAEERCAPGAAARRRESVRRQINRMERLREKGLEQAAVAAGRIPLDLA